MFSFSVINNGKVVKFTCNDKPTLGVKSYTVRSVQEAVDVEIKFDFINQRIWADVWQITNALRHVTGWTEATIISSLATGFNFYEVGTSKIQPMTGTERFNLETVDVE